MVNLYNNNNNNADDSDMFLDQPGFLTFKNNYFTSRITSGMTQHSSKLDFYEGLLTGRWASGEGTRRAARWRGGDGLNARSL